MQCKNAFQEIRGLCEPTGQPLFGQANFEIDSGGDSNLRFGFDHLDDNGFTIFDEKREKIRREKRKKRMPD